MTRTRSLRAAGLILAPLSLLVLLLAGCEQPAPTRPVPKGPGWDDSMYGKYSYDTFEHYDRAQERIDLDAVDYPLLQAAVFYAVNRQRAQANVPMLMYSAPLERAAHEHSRDMVEMNFFSHESPVTGKRTLADRLRALGVNGPVGENISTSFALEYESGKPVFGPKENGESYFSYTLHGPHLMAHTYLGFAKAAMKDLTSTAADQASFLSTEMRFLGSGAAQFKNKEFQGMDEFKVTLNFSQLPAR
jgi:Cysteine-rich secretory protein family